MDSLTLINNLICDLAEELIELFNKQQYQAAALLVAKIEKDYNVSEAIKKKCKESFKKTFKELPFDSNSLMLMSTDISVDFVKTVLTYSNIGCFLNNPSSNLLFLESPDLYQWISLRFITSREYITYLANNNQTKEIFKQELEVLVDVLDTCQYILEYHSSLIVNQEQFKTELFHSIIKYWHIEDEYLESFREKAIHIMLSLAKDNKEINDAILVAFKGLAA